ncbi:MAG: CotH kinase family protein [Bacteroidales bacterium]
MFCPKVNIILCIIAFLIQPLGAQEVRINEIISVNTTILSDENYDYEDWIELANTGSVAVDLKGYGLTDDAGDPFRWVFPRVVIQPGEFLLVWASGKDRRPDHGTANGVMREVYQGIAGITVEDLLNHPGYPDHPSERHLLSGGFETPVNIGSDYGQRLHAWLLAPHTGYYHFWIASDDHSLLSLSTDDSPANLVDIAWVRGYTLYMEWEKYASQKSEAIWLEQGQRYYIRALMKEGGSGDHLSVRWQLPSGDMEQPIAHERLLWQPAQLHANFKISQQGEPIVLSRPDGTMVDEYGPVTLPANTSYGRKADGTAALVYFDQPTPGAPNSNTSYAGVLAPPFFASPAGYYQQSFELDILHPDPQATVLFSLDGAEPGQELLNGLGYSFKEKYRKDESDPEHGVQERLLRSYRVNGPVVVQDQTGWPGSQTIINTTWETGPVVPSQEPLRGTVVRARAFKEGYLPSETTTGTYIFRNDPYPVPVISVVVPEPSFFSYHQGIYVPGEAFDAWRAENWEAELRGSSPANFSRRGIDWEREINLEFFDQQGSGIMNQRAGARIHGGWSRSFPQKSLRLYARAEYGNSEFSHQLFPDKQTNRFKRFLIRASGNDHRNTFFRDAMIQQLVKHRPIDIQHWQPAVTFVNGEYWGVSNIRDRMDKYYLHYKHGVDPDNLDVLTANAEVTEGDSRHYHEMYNYIVNHDKQDPQYFEHVNTMMDADNYAEYFAIEIYANNLDWPQNNMDYWRVRTPQYEPDAPWGHDGRWRWMIYDMDFGFWLWDTGPWVNNLERVGTGDHRTSEIFRHLIQIPVFRHMMINRFADLMNTVFHPDTVVGVVDSMQAVYDPIIEDHSRRWRMISSRKGWNQEVEKLREYARQRPGYMKEHVQEFFELTGHYSLALTVGSGKGNIRINTVELNNPQAWKGVYFNDVPIEIEALPAKGYRFSHWQGAAQGAEPKVSITASQDVNLEAHFEKTYDPELIAFWLFDARLKNDTPLEKIDASYWSLHPAVIYYHSALSGYPYSSDHTFWRKASLERRNMPTAVNYRPEANQQVPFEQADMRGLQVRQPFRGDNGANALIFNIPTSGFQDIVFRFAALDEDAADFLVVDYSVDKDSEQWHAASQETSRLALHNVYQLYEVDFTDIAAAGNNPDFSIRIQFEGENMEADYGGRVNFNNISLEGVPMEDRNLPPVVVTEVAALPAIEQGASITVRVDSVFSDPEDDPLHYTALSSNPGCVQVQLQDGILEIIPQARGEARVTLWAADDNSPAVGHTFRVLVYPMAHPLQAGDFRFRSWNATQPEGTFPPGMLFLQAGSDDPAMNDPLLYAYHLEHDQYHPEDHATLGMPYNNTRRTRINGLGQQGICFLNTGSGRDLGGALVAVNTTGMEQVRLQWTAGTLVQNERIYALRLQYRVGAEGPFRDVVSQGRVMQYTAGYDQALKTFEAIEIPEPARNQEYVQFLWRYYPVSGSSGPRSQLLLDDIMIGSLQLADEALITSFGFEDHQAQSIVIDHDLLEVRAQVNAPLNGLRPVIGVSEYADIHPFPRPDGRYEPINFEATQSFTVTSESKLVENTYQVYVETIVPAGEPDGGTLLIYPNPASGMLTLASHETIKSVMIFDVTGHLVGHHVQEGITHIPVGGLNNGMYFLKIMTHEGVYVHKIQVISRLAD